MRRQRPARRSMPPACGGARQGGANARVTNGVSARCRRKVPPNADACCALRPGRSQGCSRPRVAGRPLPPGPRFPAARPPRLPHVPGKPADAAPFRLALFGCSPLMEAAGGPVASIPLCSRLPLAVPHGCPGVSEPLPRGRHLRQNARSHRHGAAAAVGIDLRRGLLACLSRGLACRPASAAGAPGAVSSTLARSWWVPLLRHGHDTTRARAGIRLQGRRRFGVASPHGHLESQRHPGADALMLQRLQLLLLPATSRPR